MLGRKSEKKQATEKLVLALVDNRLFLGNYNYPDKKFSATCLKKIIGTEVKTRKIIPIGFLGHPIFFTVISCSPENSIVNKKTKFELIKKYTYSDMTLEESGINISLEDSQVDAILSSLVQFGCITIGNRYTIWNEFKKRQGELEVKQND